MGCEAGLGDSTKVRQLHAAFFLLEYNPFLDKKLKNVFLTKNLTYNELSFLVKKIRFIFLLLKCKPLLY